MSKTQTIREKVSEAYARAVSTPASTTCCGTRAKGTMARRAGYDEQELAAIPQDAASNSFGCGNPLAPCAWSRLADSLPRDCALGAHVDAKRVPLNDNPCTGRRRAAHRLRCRRQEGYAGEG